MMTGGNISILHFPTLNLECIEILIYIADPFFGYKSGSIRLSQDMHEVDPLICPHCGGQMRFLAVIEEPPVIERILDQIGEWCPSPPPRAPPACWAIQLSPLPSSIKLSSSTCRESAGLLVFKDLATGASDLGLVIFSSFLSALRKILGRTIGINRPAHRRATPKQNQKIKK